MRLHAWLIVLLVAPSLSAAAPRTQKPVLHGRHWLAITGKPLAATAGAKMFEKGGNAVDAACAMLAATSTMWDVLSWGGETQALIYDPRHKKVVGINALGVAPSGATAQFYREKGLRYPPEYGPLAAVTPGTPGGLITMLAEYGTLRLSDVLAPAIAMADGYPIEQETADSLARHRDRLATWKYSRQVFLAGEPLKAGALFRQGDLAATLRKLVDAEAKALRAGKNRKQAIYAAHDRFYKGDIAAEFVRGLAEEGGLMTLGDLAGWKVKIEEPVHTTYKGIEVYKLTTWTQGPVMLQALNMLEALDVRALGYNSAPYIHLLYQVMSLAFADRDFYYGDPAVPPVEPVAGLLAKEYARERVKLINRERNDPSIKPGDPYPFMGATNPFLPLLRNWPPQAVLTPDEPAGFRRGTTSIVAADEKGWVVSVTPSGGWIPAVVAGRTGIGVSQRAQQFVLDEAENPFNVIAPGKQPRVTLTPTLALKDGAPFLAFAVQGGDTQDQNLLQFFLGIVEFGMNVQEATEAANITSFQMRSSFGDHAASPGKLTLHESTPAQVRTTLTAMGYRLDFAPRTSGPINAIFLDREHATMWGGSSNFGDDYGVVW